MSLFLAVMLEAFEAKYDGGIGKDGGTTVGSKIGSFFSGVKSKLSSMGKSLESGKRSSRGGGSIRPGSPPLEGEEGPEGKRRVPRLGKLASIAKKEPAGAFKKAVKGSPRLKGSPRPKGGKKLLHQGAVVPTTEEIDRPHSTGSGEEGEATIYKPKQQEGMAVAKASVERPPSAVPQVASESDPRDSALSGDGRRMPSPLTAGGQQQQLPSDMEGGGGLDVAAWVSRGVLHPASLSSGLGSSSETEDNGPANRGSHCTPRPGAETSVMSSHSNGGGGARPVAVPLHVGIHGSLPDLDSAKSSTCSDPFASSSSAAAAAGGGGSARRGGEAIGERSTSLGRAGSSSRLRFTAGPVAEADHFDEGVEAGAEADDEAAGGSAAHDVSAPLPPPLVGGNAAIIGRSPRRRGSDGMVHGGGGGASPGQLSSEWRPIPDPTAAPPAPSGPPLARESSADDDPLLELASRMVDSGHRRRSSANAGRLDLDQALEHVQQSVNRRVSAQGFPDGAPLMSASAASYHQETGDDLDAALTDFASNARPGGVSGRRSIDPQSRPQPPPSVSPGPDAASSAVVPEPPASFRRHRLVQGSSEGAAAAGGGDGDGSGPRLLRPAPPPDGHQSSAAKENQRPVSILEMAEDMALRAPVVLPPGVSPRRAFATPTPGLDGSDETSVLSPTPPTAPHPEAGSGTRPIPALNVAAVRAQQVGWRDYMCGR